MWQNVRRTVNERWRRGTKWPTFAANYRATHFPIVIHFLHASLQQWISSTRTLISQQVIGTSSTLLNSGGARHSNFDSNVNVPLQFLLGNRKCHCSGISAASLIQLNCEICCSKNKNGILKNIYLEEKMRSDVRPQKTKTFPKQRNYAKRICFLLSKRTFPQKKVSCF